MSVRYIIFAGRKEPYLVERELHEMDLDTTMRDLASGEWINIRQIIAIDNADGTSGIWTDVTDLFARNVMTVWAKSGEPLLDWQREFIELHVSVQAANSFKMSEAV